MSTNLIVAGFRADSGCRYVCVEADNGSAILPYEKFNLANTRLAADLAAGGLPLFAKEDLEVIVRQVRVMPHFAEGLVVEHPGWNGRSFVQHDGTVPGKDGTAPEVLFARQPGHIKPCGTLDEWHRQVAEPLADHPIAAFALMSMFLPPVQRFMPQVGNLTFELVGDGSTGKSTVQQLAASAVGPLDYGHGLREVMGDVEGTRRLARDYPLMVDHVGPALLTASKARKAEIFAAVTYDLMRGPGGRVTWLSGRRPLREACGMASAEDSIVTLHVQADAAHSVFRSVPEGFASCPAFAESLIAAASSHHGVAFPHFLSRLRDELRRDHAEVERRLARSHVRFLREANVLGDNGHEYRVASAFAAVFAAGYRARVFKALPGRFPCMDIALAAFEHYRRSEAAHVPFLGRLEELIASGKIVTIMQGADPAAQAHVVKAALGTLTMKANNRIVRVTQTNIKAAFPDWDRIKATDEVRALLKLDGKNLAVWGKLAPDMERVRLFQFGLPLAEQTSLFETTGSVSTDEVPDDRTITP